MLRRVATIKFAAGVMDIAPQLAALFRTQATARRELGRARPVARRLGCRLLRRTALELGGRRLHAAMPHLRVSRRECGQGGDCS
jgi:hypothetical protein